MEEWDPLGFWKCGQQPPFVTIGYEELITDEKGILLKIISALRISFYFSHSFLIYCNWRL